MTTAAPTASQIFAAALQREIETFKGLDQHAFMQALVDIVTVPECDPDPDRLMVAHLSDRAAEGSLRAVAALLVMSWSMPQLEQRAHDATKAAAERSPDVIEAATLDVLTQMFEEIAEEEVAAGRMLRTVDPDTGHNLYAPAPRKRSKKARK